MPLHRASFSGKSRAGTVPARRERQRITAHGFPAFRRASRQTRTRQTQKMAGVRRGRLCSSSAGGPSVRDDPAAIAASLRITQLTSGGKVHQLSALATDGQRLYFQAADQARIALAEIAVSGGDSVLIPTPFED